MRSRSPSAIHGAKMHPNFDPKKFFTEIRMNGCYVKFEQLQKLTTNKTDSVSIIIDDFKSVDLTSEILDKGLSENAALKLKSLIMTSFTEPHDRKVYERFLKKGVDLDLSDELEVVFSLIKAEYDKLVAQRKEVIRNGLKYSIRSALKIISVDEIKVVVDEVLVNEILTS